MAAADQDQIARRRHARRLHVATIATATIATATIQTTAIERPVMQPGRAGRKSPAETRARGRGRLAVAARPTAGGQ